MVPSVPRRQYRITGAVAVVAATAAWAVFGPAGNWVAQDSWSFAYGWLFAPAAIGELPVGGVHSGVRAWLRLGAMCLANAAGWGAVAYVAARPRHARLESIEREGGSTRLSNDR